MTWYWCLHCERAFQAKDNKECKYADCDGHFGDIWEWESIRELHPEFPTVPEMNIDYPLYNG